MSEINRDPLDDLLRSHASVLGNESIEPEEEPVQETPVFDEDLYGTNDLANEIANEEAAYEESRKAAAAELSAKKAEADANKAMMPPDENDMKYHDDAIGFQSEKLSIVSMMAQKVVAKYRLISGGIPDSPKPELGVIGRMAVMGELIDIYHNSGEKITPEFERLILSNWVMPDGTLAIHNISADGTVIDRIAASTSENTTNDVVEDNVEEKKPETPTINITVEKNNPVTVKIDENVISQTTLTNEINIQIGRASCRARV